MSISPRSGRVRTLSASSRARRERLQAAKHRRRLMGGGAALAVLIAAPLAITAYMEAMAVGVPVVASRVAGIPELVEDGTDGLLFSSSNWGELAACVDRLLKDSEFYAALSKSGKHRVAAEFDAKKSAEILSGLFKETAKG